MQNITYQKLLFFYSFILLFFGTFQVRAQFPFSESFKNSSAANIQFGGSPPAFLTGGAGPKDDFDDLEGDGYLRLTNNRAEQRGLVWSDLYAFPSRYGMTISFEYYTHSGNGSNGADGICFVLFDATVPTVTSGAFGGSLGYAQTYALNGFSGGYLGVGIDEYGNFASNSEGKDGGRSQLTSNSIVLRGQGSGITGYPYLTSTQTIAPPYLFNIPGKNRMATDESISGFRKIEIVLKPRTAGGFFIDVYLKHDNVKSLLIDNYEYTTVAPPMVKFAITSSTGGDNNFHEIRNLNLSVDLSTLYAPIANQKSLSGCAGSIAATSDDINLNNNGTVNVLGATNRTSIDLDLDTEGIQTSKTIAEKGTFSYDSATGKVTFTPLNNSVEEAVTIDYTFNDNYGKTSNVSTITYTPIVNRPTNIDTQKTICSGDFYTWPVTGLNYNTSGTYLKINDGCTANQVLQLNINPGTSDIITNGVTVCKGNTGSLTTNTDNRPSTSFEGTWHPRTDPKTLMLGTIINNVPRCSFNEGQSASYHTITFSVNITGIYTLKMTGINSDFRAGYIYKGNYILGTCPEDGTWITGDDDRGIIGEKIPTLTANLEVGTLYTLVSLLDAYSSQDPLNYTWTLTPPDGGGFFLNPINAWYTAATGGNPIGWGATFNPVGVPGSNLPNTNTVGSTTYYVGDITGCTVRVPVVFKIKEDATVEAASSTPEVCINETLPSITHITSGITGIDSSTNLPTGVTATFATNTITISGTPTVSGIFNYSISLIKDDNYCGADTATGTITVNALSITPTVTTTNASCSASSTNKIDNYAVGNTYTFDPTGPSVDNEGVITEMQVDTDYTVTSTSATCTSTASLTFNYTAQLTAAVVPTITTTNASCSAASTSKIDNYAVGNTYTFDPTGPTVDNAGVITEMQVDTDYTVTSTNASCTSAASLTFNYTAQLTAAVVPTITTTNASCSAASTSKIDNYEVGNTYTFDPTGPSVDNEGAITEMQVDTDYTVTSTSATCTSAASLTFNYTAQLTAAIVPTITTTNASCSASSTSKIDNYAVGNTYTFDPTGPSVDNEGVITEMQVDTDYTVTSTNATCTSAASLTFNYTAQLTAAIVPTITTTNASCSAASTSKIDNYEVGNTYTFDPIGPSVDNEGVIKEMQVDTDYTVTSTNATCTSAASLTFNYTAQLTAAIVPTITTTNASCSAASTSKIDNYAVGNTYTFDPTGPTVDNAGVITEMQVDIDYTVTSTNASCTSATSLTFNYTAQLIAAIVPTITTTNASCSATSTSKIDNYTVGNTYTFDPTGPTVDNAGVITEMQVDTDYTVTSTSATCTSTASLTFNYTAQLTAAVVPTITTTNASCSAASTSKIDNYEVGNTYTFDPIGPSVDNEGAITEMQVDTDYTVTSTSATCTSTASLTFNYTAQLTAAVVPTITTTNASCSAASTSKIDNYEIGSTYTFDPTGPSVDNEGVITEMQVDTDYTVTSTNATCTSATSLTFNYTAQLTAAVVPTITTTNASCSAASTSKIDNYAVGNTYTFDPTGPSVDNEGVITEMQVDTDYTVTSTNATCTSTASLTFNYTAQLTAAVVPTITTTNASCSAASTSKIDNYEVGNTYTFDPIGPSVDNEGVITEMQVDTDYTVTSTNATCTSATSLTFNYTAQLTAAIVPTITTTNASCSATSTSKIDNYEVGNTYTFDPTGPTVDNAGVITEMQVDTDYTVTSTNATCTSTASLTFNYTAQLTAAVVPTITTTNASCSASSTSKIDNYEVGNTYTFDPTGPTVDNAGVITGMEVNRNYTVALTNATCTSMQSGDFYYTEKLEAPNQPTITANGATTFCTGDNVILSSSLSTEYLWSNGATTQNITVTSADGYSVKVINENGCTSIDSETITVTVNSLPIIPLLSPVTQPNCDMATGSFIITNYNNLYTYTITPSTGVTQNGNTITAPAENYTITAKLGTCESAVSEIVIVNEQPQTPVKPTVGTVTQPTCDTATGSFIITNYNDLYTYTITPSTGVTQNGNTITAPAENYTITAKLGTCESAVSEIVIVNEQPQTPVKPTVGTVTQPTCDTATGSFIITNYNVLYTYTIIPSTGITQNGNTITAPTENYTITAKLGTCESVVSEIVVINEQPQTPVKPTLSPVTQPNCDMATGSFIITNYNNLYTYTITPSTGITQNGNTITAPTENYTITTKLGTCQSVVSEIIIVNEQPKTPVKPTISIVKQPTCQTATGSFIITNYNNRYTYTITPSTGLSRIGNTITAPKGEYNVTATLGTCHSLISEPVLIIAPSTLAATIVTNSLIPEYCSGDRDGSFKIEITGGIMPYTVSLDNKNGTYTEINGNEDTFTNLEGGSHTVYIKDASDCITELEVIMPKATIINPVANVSYSCLNDAQPNSVSITIDPSITNLSDIDYSLDDGDFQSSNLFTNITSGTHTITARHTDGCKATKEFFIDYVEPLTLTLADGELNEIVVNTTGGEAQYRYSFNNESYSTANKFIIYKSGDYTVTVTDKNGCTATTTRYFEFIDVCIPNHFTPNGDGINDEWGPGCTTQYKNLTFTIFDRYGRIIGNYKYGQKWDGKYNGAELTTGDYWYVFKLNDNKDNREFVGHFTLYR